MTDHASNTYQPAELMIRQAERAFGSLIPFWDALADAGHREDYRAITEALQVISNYIDGSSKGGH